MQLADQLLSSKEVAAYLGVPLQTIYAWAARGTGPERMRVGRYTRYRKSMIDDWLNSKIKQARVPA